MSNLIITCRHRIKGYVWPKLVRILNESFFKHTFLLPQKIDENDVQNVFQGKAIENNGIEFFGNDIIIDPTTNYCTIPEHKRYADIFDSRAKSSAGARRLAQNLSDYSDNNEVDSDFEPVKPKKRQRKSKQTATKTTSNNQNASNTENNPENTQNSNTVDDELYNLYYVPKKSADGKLTFCQVCGKSYETKNASIKRHYKAVHKEWWSKRPPERKVRKKRSDFKDRTKDYPDIMFDAEADQYICLLCNKRSTESQTAIRHYDSVHKKIKNYTCHVCGQHFAYGHSLKRHMFLHTGMPASCDDCGKQFATEYKLREEHIRECSI